jgi:hypothetical protein
VRRELVLEPVAWDEGDRPATDLADDRRRRGRPVRRLDLDGLGRLEEGVEPGAAEDPDLGGAQDAFSPVDDFDCFDDFEVEPDPGSEDEDEDDEPESEPELDPDDDDSLPPSPDFVSDFGFERLSVA